jgi:hypothetical protein
VRLRNILILVAVLGIAAVVYVQTRPVIIPPPQPPPQEFVWLFEMEELTGIVIELPREGLKESFAKHEDRQFYFDDPPGPRADPARWGGGIPLILSGPGAERAIAKDASDEQLAIYGFTEPLLVATLSRGEADTVVIEVGDPVPDGHAYYVRVADSRNLYTVDASWYEVLARIVTEPPYPPEEEES